MSDLPAQFTGDAPDLARRFGGVARLYGQAALDRFLGAHVAVVGVGGVGSWVVEALARSAVGRLTLIDLDNVAESNINRQLQATDATLGMAKVEALRQRIATINPGCVVTCVEEFVDPDNVAQLLAGPFDAVVDAIDQVRAKVAIAAHCARQRLPLVVVGGAGGQLDPTRLRVDDLSRTVQDPLLSKVRAKLRKEHGFPRDAKKKFGIPAVYSDEPLRYPEAACAVADMAAGEVGGNVGGTADGAPAGPGLITGPQGLNCAGFGSSVCVTAPFGFAAAATTLRLLAP